MIQLEYNCPVLIFHKGITEVIVSVDKEEIRHRPVAPLKATIDVEIVKLRVVLKECGPEDLVGKIDLGALIDEEQSALPVRLGQQDIVLFEGDAEVAPGLASIGYPC